VWARVWRACGSEVCRAGADKQFQTAQGAKGYQRHFVGADHDFHGSWDNAIVRKQKHVRKKRERDMIQKQLPVTATPI